MRFLNRQHDCLKYVFFSVCKSTNVSPFDLWNSYRLLTKELAFTLDLNYSFFKMCLGIFRRDGMRKFADQSFYVSKRLTLKEFSDFSRIYINRWSPGMRETVINNSLKLVSIRSPHWYFVFDKSRRDRLYLLFFFTSNHNYSFNLGNWLEHYLTQSHFRDISWCLRSSACLV